MGKSKTPVAASGKAAVASEIDDIFSSTTTPKSSSSKATRSQASTSKAMKRSKSSQPSDRMVSQSNSSSCASELKSKSKRKLESECGPSKKRAVEVVTDTSSSIPTSTAAPAPVKIRAKVLAGNGAYDAAKQSELDDFANSRGAGERKRTDDGLRIFSPAELGMNDKGGDTELCPFDCNCYRDIALFSVATLYHTGF
ncbi:hypothetical protein PaG_00591 [Moesziomyces aphidis]|uniref:DUF1764-domain-containing protein n=1 Tax=Moesziomyces aphidis TaxID=84754 RepID=W3VT19_MOEAP|nr:hypothetical protein PaG_00591 [Moesziomyces aphidis]